MCCLSASAQASASTRSFSACPLWPFTQCHSILVSRAGIDQLLPQLGILDGLLVGRAPTVLPPSRIHPVIPRRHSPYRCDLHPAGRLEASSPRIAAISSIRLLVVSASPPEISLSLRAGRSRAAQPPGPGIAGHAPSVNISTSGSPVHLRPRARGKLEDHALRRVIRHFLGHGEAAGEGIDDFPDEDFGEPRRPR